MLRVAWVLCALVLGGCASPYLIAKAGRINRPIDVVWVGADKFIYVPGPPDRNFTFESDKLGRIIAPGLMYTDGGSVPRFAQIFRPFSPWGYAPAYVVHDWIFHAHYCLKDTRRQTFVDYRGRSIFRDVESIEFHEASLVLAEVIKTIEDNEQVALHKVPAELISAAVDSPFGAAIWESGQCARVSPPHIAMVWVRYNNGCGPPPDTWNLSLSEIGDAKQHLAAARHAGETLKPKLKENPNAQRGVVASKTGQGTDNSATLAPSAGVGVPDPCGKPRRGARPSV
jgi:hypothetical protein